VARYVADPDLDFPKPIQIVPGGPNLWSVRELDEFDRRRAAEAPDERQRRSEQARKRRAQTERRKVEQASLTAASAGAGDASATARAVSHVSTPQERVGRPQETFKRPPITTGPTATKTAIRRPAMEPVG
jgi:hypothetical protein